MTKDEFYINTQFDAIFYNEKTKFIGKVTSIKKKEGEENDDDRIGLDNLIGYGFEHITRNNLEEWYCATNTSPDWVRLQILQERFFRLEEFVYSRLH